MKRYHDWVTVYRYRTFHPFGAYGSKGWGVTRGPYPELMPVRVRLPGLLRDAVPSAGDTGGELEPGTVGELEAGTVGELIAALDLRHPGMAEALLDDSGLRRYWCVYVNGRECRYLGGLATPVTDGGLVWVLPATSGGMFMPTVPTVPAVPTVPTVPAVEPAVESAP